MIFWILLILGILLLAWIGIGIWTSRVEEPKYEVEKKTDVYEIRNYPSYILAQTEVSGTYKEALNQGFRIVAGYIFGGNTSQQKIDMTAPVVQESSSETIAMTAPVLAESSGNDRFKVSFVMPSSYKLSNLPKPNDSRIQLVQVPARRIAVLKFSGYASSETMKAQTELLRSAMERDGLRASSFETARYNPPWTPPFLMRNEVWAILLP